MLFIDDEAINETVAQLGLPEDQVRQALAVHDRYERVLKHLKAKRDEARQNVAYAKWLVAEKAANPDRCYCIEEGIQVERKYEADGIVRTWTAYSPYDWYRTNPYQSPMCRCSNCGKEYDGGFAFG